MKKYSSLFLILIMALGLMSPAKVMAQTSCDELELVVEWGCIDETIGWAVVDQVIGANGNTSILWSTGETAQFVADLPNGDHWVMVTDELGCFVKESFTIHCDKEDCELSLVIEWGCDKEELGWASVDQILGASGSTSTLWSNGATTQFVTDLEGGEHWVFVMDEECWIKEYFYVDCEKDEAPCQLRTQTQGGWGAPANGNNPGVYRDANFAGAFPSGLLIGCVNTLELTSAAAVEEFLPSGGQPQQLPAGNMIDPNNYNNVLAGQLVALSLSVGFDSYDPDFGEGGSLANATLNTGLFNGWTVSDLLNEANSFIGGCGSMYTAAQLNTGLTLVNENFVDGTTNNGHLDCGEASAKNLLTPSSTFEMRAYPVPADDIVNVDLITDENATLSVNIVDALGRNVLSLGNTNLMAQEQRTVRFNVSSLSNGSYFVTIENNGVMMRTERMIISR